MKHFIRLATLVLLLVFASLPIPTRAERLADPIAPTSSLLAPPPQGWPEDAQSTTGPVPPPGVHAPAAPSIRQATAVVLNDVPAYIWHRGCGPTAAGMVIGYWDGHGFGDLVSGSAATQTFVVNQMIASIEHYDDYSLPLDNPSLDSGPRPDKSSTPEIDEHASNSLGDFMKTSWSSERNYYGWSRYSDMDDALTGYVQWVGPQYTATAVNQAIAPHGSFTWDSYRAEIDAGRPVVLLVDTDSNGVTDHFVTGVGYDEIGGVPYYGALDTWVTPVQWNIFRAMAVGKPWGIYGATLFQIQGNTCYSLTTSVHPPGSGSVGVTPSPNCNGTQYAQGAEVHLQANASPGNILNEWTGNASGSVNPLTVTMYANKSITANFVTGTLSYLYLPVINKPSPQGIYGTVTYNGAAASGVSLELRFWNGSSYSTRATTTTGADGRYLFMGVPSLSLGQRYYVRYQNSTNDSRLSYWGTRVLTSYTAGGSVAIGDFDIANIPLASPSPGATVFLPHVFQWTRRSATPTDSYDFNLFDPADGNPFWWTNPLDYVSSYALTVPPSGFGYRTTYGWAVGVYSPDEGYGGSFYYRTVRFSVAGLPELAPRLAPRPWTDYDRDLRSLPRPEKQR